jgi:hypothetical protein
LMRTLLHSINAIFHDPPSSPRRQTISTSKILKGDAAWSYHKRILGWDLNTVNMTIHLPSHCAEHLCSILHNASGQQRISRCKWYALLGELRSMVAALHSTKHLFSILQHVLVDQPGPQLHLSPLIKQSLHDWLNIATASSAHPVPLASLVPMAPMAIGATDASKAGMGGFWWPLPTQAMAVHPIACQSPFPEPVQAALVSFTNPGDPLLTVTWSSQPWPPGLPLQLRSHLLHGKPSTARLTIPPHWPGPRKAPPHH